MPALCIASFALGAGETLYDTAARSVLPAIVPRDLLSRANGRLDAVATMNQFVGRPLGGILVVASVPLALASSALGFGLAAAGLTLLQGSFRPQRIECGSLLADIREGLSYLLRNRLLRTIARAQAAHQRVGHPLRRGRRGPRRDGIGGSLTFVRSRGGGASAGLRREGPALATGVAYEQRAGCTRRA